MPSDDGRKRIPGKLTEAPWWFKCTRSPLRPGDADGFFRVLNRSGRPRCLATRLQSCRPRRCVFSPAGQDRCSTPDTACANLPII